MRLDNKENIHLLDQHLRFIMNPNQNNDLYKPLYEVISIKRNKKTHKNDWVERLSYPKPDFAQIFKY